MYSMAALEAIAVTLLLEAGECLAYVCGFLAILLALNAGFF